MVSLWLTALTVLTMTRQVRADVPVRRDIIAHPGPRHFSVCHDNGCRTLDTLSLNAAQWAAMAGHLASPGSERQAISRTIGLFERLVGPMTGTGGDLPGTFSGIGRPGQMDCIDESSNTTTYLQILQQAGLLRWHTVSSRATRGWFLWGWPHTTAVIRDTTSGRRYAVDSWFGPNGAPAYIVPLGRWQAGWRPPAPVGRPAGTP